ncbi:MAG: hypothetical protein HDS52_05590 [Barnesiella sp.]|nr:hypothetical protein [Barnesiella sp.]
MRKLLLSGSLVAALCANAAVISPEAALKRATDSPGFKTLSTERAAEPQLVYTEAVNSEPAAYVFDRGNGGGYLVVSADDEAIPLLGYADEGMLDADNLPDGLRYWLSYYAAEIDYARTGAAAAQSAPKASAERKAIAPMVATHWNQDAPYNNDCPMSGTTRTVTGCVATALAQVMKYHNWPKQGQGSNSYSWDNTTLSLDFSTITYDWDNMLNDYTSSATDAQNAAVATLMYSCGVAVNMNYGTSESGAVSQYCGSALVNYFNYDASLRYLTRDFYTLTDWEDEVYNSLAEGCPVLYGGQSNAGGHEFVCDGYSSDGYFHFNWGWGGMSDGYFKLTSLNPDSQGIGGAGSGAGFNFYQDIIVGIKPYAGQSAFTPELVNNTGFSIAQTSAEVGESIQPAVQVTNMSYATVTFQLGLAFTDANGTTVYQQADDGNTMQLEPGYGYSAALPYYVTIPASLPDGVYTVTPAFLSSGNWYEIMSPVGQPGSVTMTVTDGVATFTTASASVPTVTEYTQVTPTLYTGMAYTFKGTIENTGELEYYGSVYGLLDGDSGNVLLPALKVDLLPGESQQFEYSGTLPSSVEAGDYQFYFVVRSGNSYVTLSDVTDVTVETAPSDTQLSLGPVSFVSGSNHVPKNDLGIQTSLSCQSGAYYGTLDMVIFYNVSGSQWQSCAEFPSEMLYLDGGQSADIVYHSDFSNGTVGQTYLVMFYHGKDQFSTQQLIVLDETSGMGGVTVADEPVAIELYNLNGQRVSEKPAPGHYIMVKRAADGSATSEHLIINE